MLDKVAHLIKGKDAESAAAAFLKKQGLKILSKNQRYTVGELDIIAEDQSGIVFIEVKYRSNPSFGSAAEMVSSQKQARLQKAASLWMQKNNPNMEKPCRFDVIAISDPDYKKIEWIKNAF